MKTVRLAPLAGVTDWPFRVLCFEQGCDCAYTEMVSAMGYIYAPKGQPATEQLLIRDAREPKLILQLFGKEPDIMAKAAGELSRCGRYDGIDINMGCPAHKVACAGEGSGLMRTPEIASAVMEQVVKASALPVSVKLRLGWDSTSINVLEMARRAEDAGVSEIAVHGRTREQQYSGEADWDMIGKVKQSVKIPVIGNGDIFTAQDAEKRMAETGVDGVMIARGAMGNPWIFRQVKARLNGLDAPMPTNEERLQMILRHYQMLLDWKEQYIAVREMRKHIAWYLHGLRGAAQMRTKINTLTEPEEVFDALRDFCLGSREENTEG